jgi:hypothetical protein
MSLFRAAGTNYMPVVDLAAATSWYVDKFGLRQQVTKFDDGQKGTELTESDEVFVLGPSDIPTNHETAMLYTSRLEKARKYLTLRGADIGEIQRDRQSTRFFEMHDLDENLIEISEEP